MTDSRPRRYRLPVASGANLTTGAVSTNSLANSLLLGRTQSITLRPLAFNLALNAIVLAFGMFARTLHLPKKIAEIALVRLRLARPTSLDLRCWREIQSTQK